MNVCVYHPDIGWSEELCSPSQLLPTATSHAACLASSPTHSETQDQLFHWKDTMFSGFGSKSKLRTEDRAQLTEETRQSRTMLHHLSAYNTHQ